MKIGYACVSTIDQNPNALRDALKAAGCEKVVTEKVSGASVKRPKFDKLLRSLNETIDTTTANGELIFHLFASMAQFERSLIVERTQAGLELLKSAECVWGGLLRLRRHKSNTQEN